MKLSQNEVKYIHKIYGKTKEDIEKKLQEPYSQFDKRVILWLEDDMATEPFDPEQCFGVKYDPDDPECQIKCSISEDCKKAVKIFGDDFIAEIKSDISLEKKEKENGEIKIERKKIILKSLKELVGYKKDKKAIKIKTKPLLKVSNWEEGNLTIYSTRGVLKYTERWKNLEIKEYGSGKVKVTGLDMEDLLMFVEDMCLNP